jgi:hypothetical protein
MKPYRRHFLLELAHHGKPFLGVATSRDVAILKGLITPDISRGPGYYCLTAEGHNELARGRSILAIPAQLDAIGRGVES